MKKIIGRLALLTILVAAIPVVITAEDITSIMNRYYGCDSSYSTGFDYCSGISNQQDRMTCEENVRSSYSSCVWDINQYRETINYCDHAREIKNNCEIYAYEPDLDIAAYSACINSSGIQYCE